MSYPETIIRTYEGGKFAYKHKARHRGHGIVAIYSHGRAGDHGKIVAEAARIMRSEFRVKGAVSSGGISGWPKDEHHGAPRLQRPDHRDTDHLLRRRSKAGPPRQAKGPSTADWCLNVVVDRNTGYLADGDNYLYYTGPYLDSGAWQEIAERITAGDELVEWKVTALQQGRFWFLEDREVASS